MSNPGGGEDTYCRLHLKDLIGPITIDFYYQKSHRNGESLLLPQKCGIIQSWLDLDLTDLRFLQSKKL